MELTAWTTYLFTIALIVVDGLIRLLVDGLQQSSRAASNLPEGF